MSTETTADPEKRHVSGICFSSGGFDSKCTADGALIRWIGPEYPEPWSITIPLEQLDDLAKFLKWVKTECDKVSFSPTIQIKQQD